MLIRRAPHARSQRAHRFGARGFKRADRSCAAARVLRTSRGRDAQAVNLGLRLSAFARAVFGFVLMFGLLTLLPVVQPRIEGDTAGSILGVSPAHAAPGEGSSSNVVDPLAQPDGSFLYEVPINVLVNGESYYSNQTVQITGEVVGDRIRSEGEADHCWITVSALPEETPASVQVYTKYESTEAIDSYGRYGVTGTTVTLRGTYYLVCPQHEGLSDIHATELTVTAPGVVHPPESSLDKFVMGGLLTAFGLVLFMYYRYVRERQR